MFPQNPFQIPKKARFESDRNVKYKKASYNNRTSKKVLNNIALY